MRPFFKNQSHPNLQRVAKRMEAGWGDLDWDYFLIHFPLSASLPLATTFQT